MPQTVPKYLKEKISVNVKKLIMRHVILAYNLLMAGWGGDASLYEGFQKTLINMCVVKW